MIGHELLDEAYQQVEEQQLLPLPFLHYDDEPFEQVDLTMSLPLCPIPYENAHQGAGCCVRLMKEKREEMKIC